MFRLFKSFILLEFKFVGPQVFHDGRHAEVDLPEGAVQQTEHAITLPEDLNELEVFGTNFRCLKHSGVQLQQNKAYCYSLCCSA